MLRAVTSLDDVDGSCVVIDNTRLSIVIRSLILDSPDR